MQSTAGNGSPAPVAVVIGPPGPVVADEVRRLAELAQAADGVPPLGEQTLLRLTDPGAPVRHLLVRDPATGSAPGRLVAYALVEGGAGQAPDDGEPATPTGVELVVAPDRRRRGLGARLLAAARAAAPGAPLHIWAHGDLPAARALAARAGLTPVDELWRMRADLTAGPAVVAPLPAGMAVRAFRPGPDDDAWVALNAAAFADHPDQGRWTRHDLRARQAEPWFDPAGLLLAERTGPLTDRAADGPGGEPVGFVWTKVHPAGALAPQPVGELYVVGVHPSAQGMGLGRALTELGLRHLADRGLDAAVLWTSASNHRAVRTYTAAGFVRDGVDVRYADQQATAAEPGHRAPSHGATMGT